MILRLRSGSATPSSFFRKRRQASTNTTLRRSRAAKRRRTWTASSLRSRPLSTNTQVRRLPIARCTMSAATAESTPPESAQITRPFAPTCSRTRSVASSTNDAGVPVAPAPAGVEEVGEDRGALLGVHHLGVEEHPVQPAGGVLHRGDRVRLGRAHHAEAGGSLPDVVAVAHPHPAAGRKPAEERPPRLRGEDRLAVLAVPGALHLAAQHVAHQLHPVADAHDRHAEMEDPRVAPRGAPLVDAVGSSGQHDALGRRAARESARVPGDRISEYTCSSLIRRAMSCVYCEPKSRMRRVSLSMASLERRIIPPAPATTRDRRVPGV